MLLLLLLLLLLVEVGLVGGLLISRRLGAIWRAVRTRGWALRRRMRWCLVLNRHRCWLLLLLLRRRWLLLPRWRRLVMDEWRRHAGLFDVKDSGLENQRLYRHCTRSNLLHPCLLRVVGRWWRCVLARRRLCPVLVEEGARQPFLPRAIERGGEESTAKTLVSHIS